MEKKLSRKRVFGYGFRARFWYRNRAPGDPLLAPKRSFLRLYGPIWVVTVFGPGFGTEKRVSEIESFFLFWWFIFPDLRGLFFDLGHLHGCRSGASSVGDSPALPPPSHPMLDALSVQESLQVSCGVRPMGTHAEELPVLVCQEGGGHRDALAVLSLKPYCQSVLIHDPECRQMHRAVLTVPCLFQDGLELGQVMPQLTYPLISCQRPSHVSLSPQLAQFFSTSPPCCPDISKTNMA